MTNNFVSKHMDHIAELTKQLHECQIGSELTPMIAVLQHTVSLHDSQAETPVSGFEEVMKSLPIHEVKSFVDGIQRLMERAKSLQDLILMTERENERKRAQACIETERQASEQRIRELMADNARLKAIATEKDAVSRHGPGTEWLPGAFEKKGRISYRISQVPPAVIQQSPAKRAGAEESPGCEHHISHPGEKVPKDSSISHEDPQVMVRPKRILPRKRQKRQRIDEDPTREVEMRSTLRMAHFDGSARRWNLEEDSGVHFGKDLDLIGSHHHVKEPVGDELNLRVDHSRPPWSQHVGAPSQFGPRHTADLTLAGEDTFGTGLPENTGYSPIGTGLVAEYEARYQGRGTTTRADVDAVPRETQESQATPRSNARGADAGSYLPANVEQESGPKRGRLAGEIIDTAVKHLDRGQEEPLPGSPLSQGLETRENVQHSMMATNESKLMHNLEQMQGVVEKLSLMLQVGEHVMGAHDECVISAAAS